MKAVKRFNFKKKPKISAFYLQPLVYILSFPMLKKRGCVIEKIGMEGLKPPYLLLSNHHSFMDFRVMSKAIYPHRANYVVTVEAFNEYPEWLMRLVGAFPKRKFINDLVLVKNMKYVVDKLKKILVVYPEARYSLDGSSSYLPDSLGKVVKFLNVPVVTLNMRGTYITSPQWSKINRNVPMEATMCQSLSLEDVKSKSVEEINQVIRQAFVYDDYEYQRNAGIKILDNRAVGLNRLLYQCPNCLKEFQMEGKENTLKCLSCSHEWYLDEYNVISSNLEGYFDSIPKWFAWQREMVKAEIESGKYYFEDEVQIETLPNSKKFLKHGKGRFVHDYQGFHLEGNMYDKPTKVEWTPQQNYGVHIEYDFRKKGDVLDISVDDDSFWIYPTKKDQITKISLATEELYNYTKNQK